MPDIPWDALLLLLLVDLLLLLAFSAWSGYVVACAADMSPTKGVVIGLLLPIVGPAVVATRHATQVGFSSRDVERGPMLWAAVGLLAVSLMGLFVATLMPWGGVEGRVGEYGGSWDASPWDTKIGAVASTGSAALLAVWIGVMLATPRRRTVALLTGALGLMWLMAAVDSWIIASLVDGVTSKVNDLSGDQGIEATLTVGPAVWLALMAGVLMLAAAALLAARDNAMSATASEKPATGHGSPASTGMWDHGYGDGF